MGIVGRQAGREDRNLSEYGTNIELLGVLKW
jgi:hypothetical protein